VKAHVIHGKAKVRVKRADLIYMTNGVETSRRRNVLWSATNLETGNVAVGPNRAEAIRSVRMVYVPCTECGR
jgi:hypothetical protein